MSKVRFAEERRYVDTRFDRLEAKLDKNIEVTRQHGLEIQILKRAIA